MSSFVIHTLTLILFRMMLMITNLLIVLYALMLN